MRRPGRGPGRTVVTVTVTPGTGGGNLARGDCDGTPGAAPRRGPALRRTRYCGGCRPGSEP
eukprot:758398-Hanusia_phi.AAC.5